MHVHNQRSLSAFVAIALVMLSGKGSRAADLTPYAALISPVSYDGRNLAYDSNDSESDELFFDVNDSWGAPGVLIYDNGSDVVIYAWLPSGSAPEAIYEGNSPQDAMAALTARQFSVGSPSSQSGSSSTVSLGSVDGGNIRGTYQVALWIFGAVLMLPIILKVRPA